jgi:hypothetical protein
MFFTFNMLCFCLNTKARMQIFLKGNLVLTTPRPFAARVGTNFVDKAQ